MTDTSIANLIRHIEDNAIGGVAGTVAIANPFTGKRIYDLPQLSAAQVEAAANRLRESQPAWAARSAADRAAILVAIFDAMIANQDKLLDVLQLETGKSRAHAFEELSGAQQAALYYGKRAAKILRNEKTKPGVPVITRTWVERVPLGLVGIITPWNYPMALAALDVFPALAAGNAVLQKADNQTALSVLLLRHFAVEAGVPADIWTVVTGDGAEVGNAVTDCSDFVAFTGSTQTGRRVYERAAANFIGASLELGGKNPMIVLEGANPAKAAEMAIGGGFGSAGQLCVSIERVYVHDSIYDNFVAELSSRTEGLMVGRSSDFDFDLGSLTGPNQLARVSGLIEDAVAKGAKVAAGGHPLTEAGPYCFAPTVLTDVPADAKLFRGEVFGPVLAVSAYSDLESAIAQANDTEYGLNASVVGPEKDAIAVARRLNAGSVNVNEGYRASFASMESPMGGMKLSGLGRRNGPAGLLKYTQPKSIGVASTGLIASIIHLPNRAREWKRMAPLFAVILKLMRR